MAMEYVRGIMYPDGRVCVEYHVTDEEEPGQIVTKDDLSEKSDQEIIAIIRDRYSILDPDYANMKIDRSWYEHTVAERKKA